MWSTTAQRWSVGVLAAVVLLVAGASATGRDDAAFEAARFVDTAVDAPLTEGGPRSTTSFTNDLSRTDLWESSCLFGESNFIVGNLVDAGIEVGDPVPTGVADTLQSRGQNLTEFEVRRWLSGSKVALTSWNEAHAPTRGKPPEFASAAYVDLIYVQGAGEPAWVVLEAMTAYACADVEHLYP